MNLPKLKNIEALVACLFVIYLSICCALPVLPPFMDGETGDTVGRKIFNFQSVPHNDPATGQDNQLSEVGGTTKPVGPTTDTFPATGNEGIFNITGFSIKPYSSDAFVQPISDQTEEPSSMDMQNSAETVTLFPMSEEEVSKTISVGYLLHDPDTAIVQLTTDVSVNLPSLMPTEEPELQQSPVTPSPSVPQHVFHLQVSVSMPPPNFTDTLSAGEAEARDIPDYLKMLQEKEMVSNTLGDYLPLPVEVSESQSTSTASFGTAGHIPMTTTTTPIIVALAPVSNSNKEELSKQSNPSSEIVAKPVFHPSGNTASTNLSPDTPTFRKASVQTLHSFHSPTDTPSTAIRKLVDINPFPLNSGWPAKMGFHTYSAPEEPMTQSFGNERFTVHAKEKPHRRVTPEFQLDVSSFTGVHSFNPDVHPVQFRYRPPALHGNQRALYRHPHDNNNSIHGPFESAPRQSRKFAFPGISSTRDNFRFRVNWVDEM